MKRRIRSEALCLDGPDRGETVNVLHLDKKYQRAEVARGSGVPYSISLEALDFDGADVEQASQFGGFSGDDAVLLDEVLR